jgi:ATP-dependent DNA helicase RecG
MKTTDLDRMVADVREQKCELDNLEVKSGRRGTPRRLFEVISAFSNRDGGGVILFGLDEEGGFAPVGVADSQKLQEDISSLCSDRLEPAVRPEFTVGSVDDFTVVGVEIPGLSPSRRPCFLRDAGLPNGAYIRVGNTNRQMTEYEVYGYVSNRDQPTYDSGPVADASLEDLDEDALTAFLERLRNDRPEAAFLRGSRERALKSLRAIRNVDGVLRPTLAGLLAFGAAPEILEPQLTITFVQFAGTDETTRGSIGERFVDNKEFVGPVPDMVDRAERYIMGHIRTRSLIDGLFRKDIPEYPRDAVREALVNAVAHRDYSPFARGSHIQVRLFADRLEISSPGGLYGNVTLEHLEEGQSARNPLLMRLMQELHLVENRGSGINTMVDAMRSAQLEPPRFCDDRRYFTVVFRNHTLMMNDEGIEWLNAVAGGLPLNDRQKLALLFARRNKRMTNGDYRRLASVETAQATKELQQLVRCEAFRMHGARGGAYYTLALPDSPTSSVVMTDDERVLELARERGFVTNPMVRERLGIEDRKHVFALLSRLVRDKRLVATGNTRARRYTLPAD